MLIYLRLVKAIKWPRNYFVTKKKVRTAALPSMTQTPSFPVQKKLFGEAGKFVKGPALDLFLLVCQLYNIMAKSRLVLERSLLRLAALASEPRSCHHGFALPLVRETSGFVVPTGDLQHSSAEACAQ